MEVVRLRKLERVTLQKTMIAEWTPSLTTAVTIREVLLWKSLRLHFLTRNMA